MNRKTLVGFLVVVITMGTWFMQPASPVAPGKEAHTPVKENVRPSRAKPLKVALAPPEPPAAHDMAVPSAEAEDVLPELNKANVRAWLDDYDSHLLKCLTDLQTQPDELELLNAISPVQLYLTSYDAEDATYFEVQAEPAEALTTDLEPAQEEFLEEFLDCVQDMLADRAFAPGAEPMQGSHEMGFRFQ